MARCRHAHSWLLAGGAVEWCPDCGGVRKLIPVNGAANACTPYWRGFVYPRGQADALAQLERVDPERALAALDGRGDG